MVSDFDFVPIDTLRRLSWPHRASLIIRHAERFPVQSAKNNHHVGLTERGKLDAQEFGRQLGRYCGICFYYSPAKRCLETAQAMAKGAEEVGVEVRKIEEDRMLSGSTYVINDDCLDIADRMGNGFIRAWFSGKIDPALIKTISAGSNEIAHSIIEHMRNDTTCDTLGINISHDWNILAMRENYLQLRHEEIGWIGFLDGLMFCEMGNSISIAYGQHIQPLKFNDNLH